MLMLHVLSFVVSTWWGFFDPIPCACVLFLFIYFNGLGPCSLAMCSCLVLCVFVEHMA